jgi:hypothetical protein
MLFSGISKFVILKIPVAEGRIGDRERPDQPRTAHARVIGTKLGSKEKLGLQAIACRIEPS